MIEREISDFQELIEAALECRQQFGRVPWFRGQTSADWRLVAPVFRGYSSPYEHTVVQRFQTLACSRHPHCPPMEDYAGWLTLMRHYGLPTRLLDWTESILVAGFFAVEPVGQPEGEQGPAALWALDPLELNTRQTRQAGVAPLHRRPPIDLLTQAFGSSKPTDRAIPGYPAQLDARMMVQHSTFTVHGSGQPLDEFPEAECFLRKYVIVPHAKPAIREGLGVCRFTASTLFPDLSHLAAELAIAKVRG